MPEEPNQNQQKPFNLQEALSDPTAKTAMNSWLISETKTLRAELERLKQFQQRYAVGQDENTGETVFLDPDEARQVLEQRKQFIGKSGGNEKKGNAALDSEELQKALKAQEEEFNKKYTAQFDPLKKQLEAERGIIRQLLVDNQLKTVMAGRVKKELLKGAESILRPHFAVIEEGDNRIAVVLGEDGKSRYGAHGRMTIEEFFNEWAQTDEGKAYILAPENGGGGDGQSNRGGSNGGAYIVNNRTITTKSNLKTTKDRSAFVHQFGADAYHNLPA
ncbi:MAG: hypothetical protein AB1656_05065 [Candidatus Omnitrophota bacterium]